MHEPTWSQSIPMLSKILEKHMYIVIKYRNDNHILFDNPFGFRQGYSTCMALLLLQDNLYGIVVVTRQPVWCCCCYKTTCMALLLLQDNLYGIVVVTRQPVWRCCIDVVDNGVYVI